MTSAFKKSLNASTDWYRHRRERQTRRNSLCRTMGCDIQCVHGMHPVDVLLERHCYAVRRIFAIDGNILECMLPHQAPGADWVRERVCPRKAAAGAVGAVAAGRGCSIRSRGRVRHIASHGNLYSVSLMCFTSVAVM